MYEWSKDAIFSASKNTVIVVEIMKNTHDKNTFY